ncbi:MAG TPA: PGPGW domain-containing protein [Acidobacteriota bacterium]|nr:PGPGW domain-containing protein [Acidobacteriota bacterium]
MIKFAKRMFVFFVGMTVLMIGVALLVLPGPAFIVIPIGLAILATEYAWARRWLRFARESAEKGVEKLNLKTFFSRRSRPDDQDTNPSNQ